MQKVICLLLAVVCLFGVSACEKRENDLLAVESDPEKIVVITDEEGYQKEISFTAKEEISEFLELYHKVEVGEMHDLMTTDSYNVILFFYDDGSSTTLSINGSSLEKEVDGEMHYFELVNIKPLWSYIRRHGSDLSDGESI